MSSTYSIFTLFLKERILVSPSILRCVFQGPDVHRMRRYAPDQRIKLLFPVQNNPALKLEGGEEWRRDYMAIPKEQRPLMRTYTLRALRIEKHEMDVEFVLHGKNSPVSNWLSHANLGDILQIVAPMAGLDGCMENSGGGCEWNPPEHMCQTLLIADETALPAALGILEQLAQRDNPPYVQAFFEVPEQGDCVNVEHFTFADVFWLPRDTEGKYQYGKRLIEEVPQHVTIPESAFIKEQALDEKTTSEGELWERATSENNETRFYGWIAAESSVVKKLRQYLLQERHLDRSLINFMAYWSKSSSKDDHA
ncbi:siderophore-interacting protein [Xenorhabdus bovienii]|uniref:FAD-binding 9 siderophore-interacting domain-containing protein n=1 Tax=Xenorhabdus bovienii str. feltiae Moldova TaxID=1398200 RepID=A0A077NXW9_XENBV|nr:siderophore-interacting protein [Xenorhabdus bovienii]CDH03620.1 FAD-binding 9 siderophore-interacting domain-containing protein [Xenorhabdus bovienii str. feltiae Moldova]